MLGDVIFVNFKKQTPSNVKFILGGGEGVKYTGVSKSLEHFRLNKSRFVPLHYYFHSSSISLVAYSMVITPKHFTATLTHDLWIL